MAQRAGGAQAVKSPRQSAIGSHMLGAWLRRAGWQEVVQCDLLQPMAYRQRRCDQDQQFALVGEGANGI
ncbi:MAG: hypothetical protein ACYDCW_16085 [Acidithiobacillus ferrivorans]